jgi:Ca-activated chloride channel family protein
MSGLRFQDPWWLLLWIPLAVIGLLAIGRQRRVAVLFSDVSVLATLPRTLALRLKRGLPWLRLLGMALVILALARPQRGREEFRLRTEGVAIQMCIDRSGSMEAMDFEVDGYRASRVTMVKRTFRDFVVGKGPLPGRPDDLIGLIAFGGFAEAKCPLTLDHGALLQILDTIEVPKPIRDDQGNVLNERLWQEDTMTAIGDAVTLAVDRLKDVKAKSKVIILLSDGEQNAGVAEPEQAAKTAKAFGVKIYSIGVGTTGMVPFPQQDRYGCTELRPMAVRLDEKTLKTLADNTGGRYYNAQDTATLEKIYADIDRLERSLTTGRLYMEYRELYQYLMFPGLALMLLEVGLACTRFRSLP